METLYIKEKNYINNELKTINLNFKRNEDVINRFLSKTTLTKYEEKQINDRQLKNDEYKKEQEILQKRLLDLNIGLLDTELNTKYNSIIEVKPAKPVKPVKPIQHKYVQQFTQPRYKNSPIRKYNYKNNDKGVDKETRYATNSFFKMCKYIPKFILRNLKDMPNNRGYIIRNEDYHPGQELWVFGELPAESGEDVVMFEKKGDTLYILEISKSYKTLYEKRGKNKKVLISKEPRIKKF